MKQLRLYDVVEYFGGKAKAAKKLKFSRQYISFLVRTNNLKPSIELCKRIEKVTNLKFTLQLLRPDIFK